MSIKKFSLDYKIEFFRAESEDAEAGGLFIVRSLRGDERDKFLKAMDGKMDSKQKVKDMEGVNALLLTFAVKRVDEFKDGEQRTDEEIEQQFAEGQLSYHSLVVSDVNMKTIQSWPAIMQEQLNETAMEFSGLGKTAREDAKNE